MLKHPQSWGLVTEQVHHMLLLLLLLLWLRLSRASSAVHPSILLCWSYVLLMIPCWVRVVKHHCISQHASSAYLLMFDLRSAPQHQQHPEWLLPALHGYNLCITLLRRVSKPAVACCSFSCASSEGGFHAAVL
jgi:hypothetical protein